MSGLGARRSRWLEGSLEAPITGSSSVRGPAAAGQNRGGGGHRLRDDRGTDSNQPRHDRTKSGGVARLRRRHGATWRDWHGAGIAEHFAGLAAHRRMRPDVGLPEHRHFAHRTRPLSGSLSPAEEAGHAGIPRVLSLDLAAISLPTLNYRLVPVKTSVGKRVGRRGVYGRRMAMPSSGPFCDLRPCRTRRRLRISSQSPRPKAI